MKNINKVLKNQIRIKIFLNRKKIMLLNLKKNIKIKYVKIIIIINQKMRKKKDL